MKYKYNHVDREKDIVIFSRYFKKISPEKIITIAEDNTGKYTIV